MGLQSRAREFVRGTIAKLLLQGYTLSDTHGMKIQFSYSLKGVGTVKGYGNIIFLAKGAYVVHHFTYYKTDYITPI